MAVWMREWLSDYAALVEDTDGQTTILCEKPVPVPLCPPEIPQGIWEWNQWDFSLYYQKAWCNENKELLQF